MVDLSDDIFTIEGEALAQAYAQIVWTATELGPAATAVRFAVDGEPTPRARRRRRRARTGAVTPSDYAALAPGRLQPTRRRLLEEHLRDVVELGVDQLQLADRVGQRDAHDAARLRARPSCPTPPSCTASMAADAEAGGEHAVEGRGRAAALHVAEHGDPGLVAGAGPRSPRRGGADAAEADVAEGVELARLAAPACPPWASRPRRPPRSRRSRLPSVCRCRIASHTASTSKGCSGMRMIVAPPAMPAHAAMWPAWRPITSTTITRSWLSAVVCSRSMASTQICTAVSKPKVSSVAERSLSIVFGTPTTWHALAGQPVRHAERVLAADGDERVDAVLGERAPAPARGRRRPCRGWCATSRGSVPPRGRVPRQLLDAERHACGPRARPASRRRKPIELVAVDPLALAGDRPHHRVEPGAVAAAGEHRRLACALLRVSVARSSRTAAVTGRPAAVGCPADVRRGRHRRRDHRRARVRGRDDGTAAGFALPGVHPALPPARAGWSTTPPRSGRAVQATLAELAAEPRRADRRHRHHRPARDGRGVGPTHRRSRCTGPSSGRTAAPRPAATSCATRASSRIVRATTGLVLDPYFTATKVEWLLTEGGVAADARPGHRHHRRWVLWNLTGGPDGGVLATEPSNASRTMLFDIRALAWSDELLDLFGVPASRAARGAPVERAVRRHRRRHRRARGHPGVGHRRRPAGGPVRPGVLRAGR